MSAIESLFCRTRLWQSVARNFVLPWCLQGAHPRGAVLELGGGSGAMAAQILASSAADSDLSVTVSDFDPAMVAAAHANLAEFGSRATAEVADATRLPFPDESFDTVLSLLMLHHVIEWEAAISEAARVLRPGGELIGYDLVSTPPARFVHTVDRSPHRFIKRGELERRLADLPFTDVRITYTAGLIRFHAVKDD